MGRQFRLLAAAIVIASAATLLAHPTQAWAEDPPSKWFGYLNENSATVGAQGGGRSGGSEGTGWVPPEGWFLCNERWLPPEAKPTAICRDQFTVNGPPVPTLSDVREFFPASASVVSEPDGWAVKGKPVNFVVPTRVNTSSGTVLGLPTEVRFTPTSIRWDYGDGTTATTTTGGATWQELGQQRFTPTATSHVYDTRAERTASATVEYSVSYRFAGGQWRPIDGTLSIPTDPLPVRVVVGSTVLVDAPCSARNTTSC